MGAGHSHVSANQNERSLWIALGLTTGFLIAEVIGGIVTGSLALISDAAHMFTDAAALAIALAAMRIARRPADRQRSFGYYRFEILAAAFNALLLFCVALYILYEAYRRLESPPEIQSTGMLVVAVLGLMVNLVSMRFLSGGKEENLNVKGASAGRNPARSKRCHYGVSHSWRYTDGTE
jgi:cobalt-zinc-cadmium efflux system protein